MYNPIKYWKVASQKKKQKQHPELDFDRGETVYFPMLLLISPLLSFAWKGECFVLVIDN